MSRAPWGGLPAREFLHPAPLLAVALLAFNDHVLKQSAWVPGWLSGKLSDFAGLFYFPLLLTALWNTASWGLRGGLWGPGPDSSELKVSLRRWQLLAAIVITGVAYSALKVWPPAAALGAQLGTALRGSPVRALVDPTDLVALLVLPLTYLHARRYAKPADRSAGESGL